MALPCSRLSASSSWVSVRIVDAGDHIHQSGLAGAVFTQQGKNLAGFHIQVNAVVGHHTAEGFGNAFQFNGVLFAHGFSSFCFVKNFKDIRQGTDSSLSYIFEKTGPTG